VVATKRVLFEGGTLEGQSFELPPGTVEVLTARPMPGCDRYQLVVRDDGVFASWTGVVPGPQALPGREFSPASARSISPECIRNQARRVELLRELTKLEAKVDAHAPWPRKVADQFATLSLEQNRLREEWLRLGCADQLFGKRG
jgi:hypothetical protein